MAARLSPEALAEHRGTQDQIRIMGAGRGCGGEERRAKALHAADPAAQQQQRGAQTACAGQPGHRHQQQLSQPEGEGQRIIRKSKAAKAAEGYRDQQKRAHQPGFHCRSAQNQRAHQSQRRAHQFRGAGAAFVDQVKDQQQQEGLPVHADGQHRAALQDAGEQRGGQQGRMKGVHAHKQRRRQQGRHRARQPQKPHGCAVLPAHVAVIRRMAQMPQVDRHHQRPGAAVQQHHRLTLQQKAHHPVRAFRQHGLRQRREGIILQQLLQLPDGGDCIQRAAREALLQPLHRAFRAHIPQIADGQLPADLRAHRMHGHHQLLRGQLTVQQRQVIPQHLVERFMRPDDHPLVHRSAHAAVHIPPHVDDHRFRAAVQQHKALSPEHLRQRGQGFPLGLDLRRGDAPLHGDVCQFPWMDAFRHGCLQHGSQDMLRHLVPLRHAVDVVQAALRAQRLKGAGDQVVVFLRLHELLHRLLILFQRG